MSLRTLLLVAAVMTALPAAVFAQNTPENRAAEAAYRAQVAAEAAALESQQRQVELMNQQRDMQARLDAIETQRRADDALRPPASPTTTQTLAEQQRQRDLENRLSDLERQQLAQQRLASLSPPPAVSAIPRLTPFGLQAAIGAAANSLERQQAADRFADCLTANARRLDDRLSDAGTVAKAIAGACRLEDETWRGVMRRGVGRENLAALDQALAAGSESGAIQAVLQARRSAAR